MEADTALAQCIDSLAEAYEQLAPYAPLAAESASPLLALQQDVKAILGYWLVQDRIGVQAETALAAQCEALIERRLNAALPLDHLISLRIQEWKHWVHTHHTHGAELPALVAASWRRAAPASPAAQAAVHSYVAAMDALVDALAIYDGNLVNQDIAISKTLKNLWRD